MDNNLPHYTRIRLLGEGGMGKVYLAQDNQLQRQVAIKELTYQSPNTASVNSGNNASQASQALHEARLLARVNHTNIIQIYNVHDEGDHISLVMEYFQSKTLTQFQHESHSTLVQKLDLLQQLAAGLSAAHKNDVIHCDLKPTNILVNEQGQLKISDFGIGLISNNDNESAKSLSAESLANSASKEPSANKEPSTNNKPASLLFGSLLFMSPEQIQQQQLDYRSDIFSFGIIAYQLMVGSHPFGRGSATDIAERICKQQPEHAKNLMLNAPSALTDLLMEMLIQPLEQRTLSASAIENRIKHIRTALLQAEINEQETMPLSADNSLTHSAGLNANELVEQSYSQNSLMRASTTQAYSYILPNDGVEEYPSTQAYQVSLANHQGKLSNNVTPKWFKKHGLKSLLSFFFIIIVAAISWFRFIPKSVPPIQVVVLKPVFVDSEEMAMMQQELVLSAVEDALRQAVINTKDMYLISQREVNAISKEYPNDLKKLKQAVGASDIITTELACDNNRCNVNFSRLVANEKNTHTGQLTVKAERNWLAPVDKFNAIFSSSQAQFASIFPDYTEVNDTALVHRPIKEEDYRAYLALYNQIKGHGDYNEESLTQLETLLIRSPYLYAAYALYSETASNLYVDTREDTHLKRLELVLQKSPPEYRYSLYHAIDSFWLAFNQKNFDAAELQIEEARNRGASNFTLTELEAILFFSKGQFQKAVNSFEEALTLRPNTALLYNLVLSYWELGDLQQAERILNKMLDVTPNNYRAIRLQANIWLLQGKIDLTIEAYEKIIENKVGVNINDLTNLSFAYSLDKQYLKSLDFAHKALSKSSMHPINLLNLADIEMIIGNEQAATVHYQEVIDILSTANDVKYLIYLAQAYGHLNQADLAIAALDKAQSLFPESGEVAYSSAIVYSLLNEKSSAIYYIKASLKMNIGIVWFNLPWFDNLCDNSDFLLLMISHNSARCEL
ncbi:protein kinase [Colwellia sp. E2M01]|uniref:protein kinase domain-containing protein n=1 Tax=Colwellia sp. E2M01 TaxID=2841561 RepID=UPI001C081441|nr:protein kinase [Colwellia sp. E2M01]MBU2872011.1 protein kinase [Colwellia sp. E2M01]